MQITRRLEFDAGHRIPNHTSQCKYLHGHRWRAEITLSMDITREGAEQGMVMDFPMSNAPKSSGRRQIMPSAYRGDTWALNF
jgi:6-pyruvoyl-tetrahydropterin synthase